MPPDETVTSPRAERPPRLFIALFCGSGIGLLIGVLMGLAVSPTVGVIIGVLSSSLALLLGLNDQHFGDAKAVRIGAFGFFCVAGSFTGIYLRNHNVLSPGLEAQTRMYTDVGYTDKEARAFIAYTKFNIIDPKWTVAEQPAPSSGSAEDGEGGGASNAAASGSGRPVVPFHMATASTVLFGATVDSTDCMDFNDNATEANVVGRFYHRPGIWGRVSTDVAAEFAESDRPAVLMAFVDAMCRPDGSSVKFSGCTELAGLAESTPLSEIVTSLTDAGPPWEKLVAAVQSRIEGEDGQRKVLLIAVRNFCIEKQN